MPTIDSFELLILATEFDMTLEQPIRSSFGDSAEKFLIYKEKILGIINDESISAELFEDSLKYRRITLCYASNWEYPLAIPDYDEFKLLLKSYLANVSNYSIIFEVDCDQYPLTKMNSDGIENVETILDLIGNYYKFGFIEYKAILFEKR